MKKKLTEEEKESIKKASERWGKIDPEIKPETVIRDMEKIMDSSPIFDDKDE